ncbi:hypothetical protein Q8A64_08225 [Oxalobacteraceae bacterium R-40]|uniref:Uncharacterized protein n=1 Tax=Keguizhuia sedimenti TaxID=3064264 RepID=A0ABU1BNA7_9BURK|nr:hypothetical protein [Oxalobacteraceae bacterium R-40]
MAIMPVDQENGGTPGQEMAVHGLIHQFAGLIGELHQLQALRRYVMDALPVACLNSEQGVMTSETVIGVEASRVFIAIG